MAAENFIGDSAIRTTFGLAIWWAKIVWTFDLIEDLQRVSEIYLKHTESYVLTSKEIQKFVKLTGKGYVINYSKIRDEELKHKENWIALK